MIHVAEVIDTKYAFKPNFKDEDNKELFLGTIQVRIASNWKLVQNVVQAYAAPLSFNKRIPLVGEHVLLIQAPYVEKTQKHIKGVKYYYLSIVNSVNNMTIHNFKKLWERKGPAKGTNSVTDIIADREQYGYTIDTNPSAPPMLQPFEGDDLFEGRFGQSIRFSRHYTTVYSPGIGIYQQQGKLRWPGKNLNDPIVIIRNTKSSLRSNQNRGYTLEDLSKDDSSIYLTSTQKLLKFTPGFKKNQEVAKTPVWQSGSQIVVSSDRVIFNAKSDIAFIIGKKKAVVTGNKVLLQSNKYKVDLDDLMDWLKKLAGELNKNVTAQAPYTSSMGPTGPAKNAAQVSKLVNMEFRNKFKKP